ncbi:MAG: hypothetical protein JWL83_986 [Actinomycetia bacterium]|nr:hypothetical protein [Actinomycetes bacterium]
MEVDAALAALGAGPESDERADHQRLLASGRWRHRFARGEVLYRAGDVGDTVHVVAKGHVALRTLTPLGDEVTFSVLGPGDVGGLAALMGAPLRVASAVALDACETHEIAHSELVELRLTNPTLDQFLLERLADQFARLAEHLLEALYVPAESRVLRRLQALAPLYGNDLGATIVVPLTQDDLANLAGTSRPTTNRVLRIAQDAGVLTIHRGRVEIHHIDGLAELAR